MDLKVSDVGVIVGRFQVHELHPGQEELIRSVFERHPKTIIFLGVSPLKTSYENPLDFESRKQMIEQKFPGILVTYIFDTKWDYKWSKDLDQQIHYLTGPTTSVVLYGGRDSFVKHYEGGYPTVEMDQEVFTSGTIVREDLSRTVRATSDFRAGVIWATQNRFYNAVPCVDVAILNHDCTKILLGRKKNVDPPETYRLIGGFVDPEEHHEHTAAREVKEETNLDIMGLVYVGSYVIDDWRYKSEINKIATILYATFVDEGIPKALDDIDELRWCDIKEDGTLDVFTVGSHAEMFRDLRPKLKVWQAEFKIISNPSER